jgi:hypothetical protein
MADVRLADLLARERAQNEAMRELLEAIVTDLERLANENRLLAKPLRERAARLRFRLQNLPRWKP